ncbi:hypothetical protein CA603_22770 [Paraburkholderia hospita]|nr:hypothetical protein CA603_22770 [Paraburkholderia hospita]
MFLDEQAVRRHLRPAVDNSFFRERGAWMNSDILVVLVARARAFQPMLNSTGDTHSFPIHSIVYLTGHLHILQCTCCVFARYQEPFMELVGREHKLSVLRKTWHDAVGGQSQVAALVAEAHLGKTRVVQEFHCGPN